MQITKRRWTAAGIGFAVAVLAFFARSYYAQAPAQAPLITAPETASSTSGTSTTAVTTTVEKVQPFAVNAADIIAAWNFTGTYTGDTALETRTKADIEKLTGLLGKGEYDDYDLYIGIGDDYGLIGNGTLAYENFKRATAVHPDKGLAYANIAHLMNQLGAYYTAADAYARAVAAEPGMLEYHIERLTYLTRQFPTDTARITAALAAVSKRFGDTVQILAIEAEWLTGQKRYADAIKAWETVKTLSPGKDMSAIDAEIARLRSKQ